MTGKGITKIQQDSGSFESLMALFGDDFIVPVLELAALDHGENGL